MSNCLVPCPGCPFGGPKVGGRGDPNSTFVIIGESPGKQEVEKGLPFVGPSGKVLDSALNRHKLHPIATPEPWIMNAMQCYPGDAEGKDETRMVQAINACRQRVLEEINAHPRRVVLALGAWALRSLAGNPDLKITAERGKVFNIPGVGAEYVFPSVHPAFLMRGGSGATHQQFLRDVEYSLSVLKGATTTKKPPVTTYEIVRDERDIRDLGAYFRSLPKGHVIGADTETSGFSHLRDRVLCAGYAPNPEEVYVIPEHLAKAQSPLFDNECSFLWHNGKFDVRMLRGSGIKNARCDEDTMLLSYATDEYGGIHDLEQVSSDYVNSPNWKAMLDSYLPNRKTSYEVIPKDILQYYMALDIGNMYAAFLQLRERVRRDVHLERLYTRTLIPASKFLAKVEEQGLFVDKRRVSENVILYEGEIQRMKLEFLDFTKPFPNSGYTDKLINSPKQMNQFLYDDLKIRPLRGKRTTDKKVLEKLPKHPVIDALFKARKFTKEYGTYVKNIPNYLDIDGRVHATYLLHGTTTGRLASRNPNLQNVPRNPRIRGQYVAAPGRRFLEPDLNQAELRVLACLSNDRALCHIYETEGMSLHDEVRADIWGYRKDWSPKHLREQLEKFQLTEKDQWGPKGEDRVYEEQKMRAKAVNFGIVYGRTAPGIAEEFVIPTPEAQGWINKWFKKFPDAKKFIDRCRNAPLTGAVLVTPFGNKRRFGVVGRERQDEIMNQASNFPEQCCASHITLHTGIEIQDYLEERWDAKIVNLVHDSILIDIPDNDIIACEVSRYVIDRMENMPKKWGFTRIPFIAEAKMGYKWGSLSKYDPFKPDPADIFWMDSRLALAA